MSEENALLALKNAWSGAVAASGEIEKLAPSVAGLAPATPVSGLDLDQYGRVTLAQAIAASALRGLVEELRRKRDEGKQI